MRPHDHRWEGSVSAKPFVPMWQAGQANIASVLMRLYSHPTIIRGHLCMCMYVAYLRMHGCLSFAFFSNHSSDGLHSRMSSVVTSVKLFGQAALQTPASSSNTRGHVKQAHNLLYRSNWEYLTSFTEGGNTEEALHVLYSPECQQKYLACGTQR